MEARMRTAQQPECQEGQTEERAHDRAGWSSLRCRAQCQPNSEIEGVNPPPAGYYHWSMRWLEAGMESPQGQRVLGPVPAGRTVLT